MTRSRGLFVSLSLCLAWMVSACDGGGSEDDASTDTASPDTVVDTSTDITTEPGDCPGPPFGTSEGDTIANHVFTTADGGDLDLCSLAQVPGNRVLLVYGTAGWCTACTYESSDLPGMYDDYHSQGLEVLAVVFEDESSATADSVYASGYRDYYGFTFPTVTDPDFLIGSYFDRSSAPLNMFVDLETMEILEIGTGYATGGGPLRGAIEGYLGI